MVFNKHMDNPLFGYWADSGINAGDTVLVHSSMKRTFRHLASQGVQDSSRVIIDSLLDLIGNNGTILFPLFNFDFPTSKMFSMVTTPSQMGVITEYARNNYEGHRTGHPIYSFYAIGRNSDEFRDINNKSGYGTDSPFAKLLELDGKIASIDLDDQNSMTTYHFVEEMLEVDYRYFKSFHGKYENKIGAVSSEEYTLFVRNLEKRVVTNVNRMGEILWADGFYQGSRPGVGHGMRSIKIKNFVSRTTEEIVEGRAIHTLYSIE
jgi:aminoglycoside N3'-acetyltransferase